MPSTETLVAHCGACTGRMVLIQTADAWWYACTNPDCGESTDPRPTPAEAAKDVVWVSWRKPQSPPKSTQALALLLALSIIAVACVVPPPVSTPALSPLPVARLQPSQLLASIQPPYVGPLRELRHVVTWRWLAERTNPHRSNRTPKQ